MKGRRTIVLHQMTVCNKHPVMLKGIVAVMNHFGTSFDYLLCFVVPENVVAEFKQQNYLTNAKKVAKSIPARVAAIDQYVLGLRYVYDTMKSE